MRPGALLLLATVTACAAEPAPDIRAARLRADLTFLTSRTIGSRAALDRGSDIAAEYLAGEFARAGLAPFDGNRYLQPFSITEFRRDPVGMSLSVERKGVVSKFRTDTDYRGGLHRAVARTGPLVFAGYGITAPEYRYDDYRGIDASGKVLLIIEHEPQEGNRKSKFRGEGFSVHSNLSVKLQNAQKHGAAAVLVMPEPKRSHRSQFDPPLAPPAPDRGNSRGGTLGAIDVPYFYVTEETAARLLDGTGETALGLQSSIDRSLRPHSFAIEGSTVTVQTAVASSNTGRTFNVIGVLEGSDAKLKNEFVLVTSHYDHLPNRGEHFYPGANDNGSGTVAIARDRTRIRRRSTAPAFPDLCQFRRGGEPAARLLALHRTSGAPTCRDTRGDQPRHGGPQ